MTIQDLLRFQRCKIRIFFREDFFPDGGIEAYIKHKFPLVAHNRWFGPDNVYAKENGGQYDFVTDDIEVDLPGPPGSGRGPYAYPNDTKFWPDFMSDRKQWGLITYEQDWARSNSFSYSKMAEGSSR